ncbi:MAG TPA: MFS transporter [Steroidobacteraceae bacterium]|nr:MFS transporter [Steroidobacteraceae bacterium]
MTNETPRRLAFIELAPGVLPRHALAYLFAAFVSIGLFAYLSAMTPFILSVNLSLPEAQHGRASGLLQGWQEVIILLVIGWWGALSDRIGRRPVYVGGFLLISIAYFLYPLADSLPELVAYRVVFGCAVAALGAMLATVLADYPRESSRGKLSGVAFFLNALGSVVFLLGLTQLPRLYAAAGASQLEAGRYAFFTIGAVALLAACVMFGLKPGLPTQVKSRKPMLALIREGMQAARNPRIALAYGGGFISRADLSLITLFLALWAAQSAQQEGLSAAQAAGRVGITIGVTQLTAMVWAPVYGWLADHMNRTVHFAGAFALALVGYGWVGMQDDIVATSALPALIMLGVGQSSTILAATILLGQEAPRESRGSVFGLQAFCGGLGILAISWAGGLLYDHVAPSAPFTLVGVANAVVALWAVWVYLRSRRAPREESA